MSPTQRTHQLLELYLPPKDGRTPAQRLYAIAGKAIADSRRRIPELTHAQIEDAFGELLKAGTDALHEYNPNRDNGTSNGIPIDTRFGRFAYLRMRQRFIDWYRREIHDNRPGKSDRRTLPLADYDRPTDIDFTDLVATDDRIQRWTTAATILGFDLTSWILDTLDEQAQSTIDKTAA